MRYKISSISFAIGSLLLASGCLWGAGIMPTSIPMYVGIGVIAITVFILAPTTKSKGEE